MRSVTGIKSEDEKLRLQIIDGYQKCAKFELRKWEGVDYRAVDVRGQIFLVVTPTSCVTALPPLRFLAIPMIYSLIFDRDKNGEVIKFFYQMNSPIFTGKVRKLRDHRRDLVIKVKRLYVCFRSMKKEYLVNSYGIFIRTEFSEKIKQALDNNESLILNSEHKILAYCNKTSKRMSEIGENFQTILKDRLKSTQSVYFSMRPGKYLVFDGRKMIMAERR